MKMEIGAMKTKFMSALGAVSLLFAIAMPAQNAVAAEAVPSMCLQAIRIDHTRVVDNQTILFYTRGGGIYLNRLSHAVIGLRKNRPFMYRTTGDQICTHDLITVLEDWGFGFRPGASAALGRFEPIDEARALTLIEGRPADAEADAELEPVETE
jgi:hypothetical protein